MVELAWEQAGNWTVETRADGGQYKWPLSSALSTTETQEPMVYLATTRRVFGRQWWSSQLYFCAFDRAYQGLYYEIPLLTETETGEYRNYQVSISYTPGDKIHLVFRDSDGNQRYYTWLDQLTPDQIRSGAQPTWVGPILITENAKHPSVDAYGEYVYCTYSAPWDGQNGLNDVFKSWHRIGDPPDWWWGRNVSNSPDRESDYSQPATSSTVAWQEHDGGADTRADILVDYGCGQMNMSIAPGSYTDKWPQLDVRNPVPPWDIAVDWTAPSRVDTQLGEGSQLLLVLGRAQIAQG